jgi:hypothetical protein
MRMDGTLNLPSKDLVEVLGRTSHPAYTKYLFAIDWRWEMAIK